MRVSVHELYLLLPGIHLAREDPWDVLECWRLLNQVVIAQVRVLVTGVWQNKILVVVQQDWRLIVAEQD